MVPELLSAHVERFSVSRIQDFYISINWCPVKREHLNTWIFLSHFGKNIAQNIGRKYFSFLPDVDFVVLTMT